MQSQTKHAQRKEVLYAQPPLLDNQVGNHSHQVYLQVCMIISQTVQYFS